MSSGLFRFSHSTSTTVLCSRHYARWTECVSCLSQTPAFWIPFLLRPLPVLSVTHLAISPALSTCTQRTRDTQPARFFITSNDLQVACIIAEVALDFIRSGFCPSYSGCSRSTRTYSGEFSPRPPILGSIENSGVSLSEALWRCGPIPPTCKCWGLTPDLLKLERGPATRVATSRPGESDVAAGLRTTVLQLL